MSRSPRLHQFRFPLILPAFLLVAVLGLAACSKGDREPTFLCPRTGMIQDADRLFAFKDMAAPRQEDITVAAEIEGFDYACRPVPARGAMDYRLTVNFVAARQPIAAEMRGLTLPYFVAILDDAGEIVSRTGYEARLTFGEQVGTMAGAKRRGLFGLASGFASGRGTTTINADMARVDATHVFDVPVPDPMTAGGYRIAIGFELVPEQVDFNRTLGKPTGDKPTGKD